MAILTVYTKLLDKTLEGARIIDMGSTKSCECFVLPRDKVAEIGKKQSHLQQYGFYILLGHDKNMRQMAYLGQTYDFTNRVIDHKQKKDFWDTALVFVSKSNEIYPSEALYLEYLGWKAATEAGNYIIDNTKDIYEPPLSEDKQNEMELFFEDIQFLTRFYGCKVFDKPEKTIIPCPPKPENTVPMKLLDKQKNAQKREPKVWMIPANPKYFDHRACFDELGQVYWKQYNNLQAGDIGYIYYSAPLKRIVFKFEIIACDIPYSSEYDAEEKYYKKPDDFDNAKKHNRFYLIKRVGENTNGKLTLKNMMIHGLRWAPQGSMNLSNDSFKELLTYIESNF